MQFIEKTKVEHKPALDSLQIPMQVLDAIDQGENPERYSREILEKACKADQLAQERQVLFSTLASQLQADIEK